MVSVEMLLVCVFSVSALAILVSISRVILKLKICDYCTDKRLRIGCSSIGTLCKLNILRVNEHYCIYHMLAFSKQDKKAFQFESNVSTLL